MNEMHNLNVHCIFTYSSYVEVGRPTFFRLILEFLFWKSTLF